jgi:hypothetical protein
MDLELEIVTMPTWPPLAWLAECRPGGGPQVVRCLVGEGVETGADRFCEAVWAGPYADGDFDRTDLVFGSGARVRDGIITFVSSGSTVDRLHSLRQPQQGQGQPAPAPARTLVSNSLACLLAAAGGSLDVAREDYSRIFNSIRDGIRRYERHLPTSAGPVELTYFDNLRWDGNHLATTGKPDERRDFGSYERYRAFMSETMAAIVANATDPSRRRHRFTPISTLSAGYDSPATTVLAREAGCCEAFGFDRARGGGDDSGQPIADVLGIRFQLLASRAWRADPFAVLPFLAAGTGGGADVIVAGAGRLLQDRLLFTGFHGDKVWNKRIKDVSPDIVRGDNSGAGITEYRLSASFVHCPVPFWGVRQIRDIRRISGSPELAPWDIAGAGFYNRPIPRRIVEECGVPRQMFGASKKATTTRHVLMPDVQAEYLEWLDAQPWSRWVRRGRLPPVARTEEMLRAASETAAGLVDGALGRRLGRPGAAAARKASSALAGRADQARRRRQSFQVHWGVERRKAAYPMPADPPSDNLG